MIIVGIFSLSFCVDLRKCRSHTCIESERASKVCLNAKVRVP